MEINCLNIQGLTNAKIAEIEQLIEKNTVMCLTETQLKIDKIKISEKFNYISNMREGKEKKGGGLMILNRKEDKMEITKIETKNKVIIQAVCKMKNFNFHLFLVYFPSSNKEEDKNRRGSMKLEMERLIRKTEEDPFIILGDFNSHVGFLGPQRIDEGGTMIVKWMEELDQKV